MVNIRVSTDVDAATCAAVRITRMNDTPDLRPIVLGR